MRFHNVSTLAMIPVVSIGKRTLRGAIWRAHRVSVAWLHELVQMKEINTVYEENEQEGVLDSVARRRACDLIQKSLIRLRYLR